MIHPTRSHSVARRHRRRTTNGGGFVARRTLQTTLQWAILLSAALFYIMARDANPMSNLLLQEHGILNQSRSLMTSVASIYTTETTAPLANSENVKRDKFWLFSPSSMDYFDVSSSARSADDDDHHSIDTAQQALEDFLDASIVTDAGKELVRYYQHRDDEKEPLRHLQFDHLDLPEIPKNSPTMTTAYLESTVITQAPWFPHRKECNETCCAQAVAISLKQDRTPIINAVDGQDVADLLLYGHTPAPIHKFAASELTDDIIPCLRPGVIIHADSYRGPITRFFQDHRPKITVPYVFLTTKTDGDSPITFFKDRLDTDPLLLAWYGINPKYELGANHSKFRMMPLGLTGNKYRQQPDLDLLMQARNHTNPFGGSKEKWLNASLWDTVVDTTPLLFVKFGFHENALHRDVPWKMACENRTTAALDNISCNKKIGANPRQTYTAASKYLFGLSPPGNGLDCFRTYELLLNGVIPVVQAQPEYDELFDGLPVLQLPHWNYSQQDLVQLMHNYVTSSAFRNNTFEKGWDRLFLQYWRQKVLKDAGRLNEIVTDPEGNQYYTAWQYSLYKKPHIQHAIPAHVEAKKRKQEQQQQKLKQAQQATQEQQAQRNVQQSVQIPQEKDERLSREHPQHHRRHHHHRRQRQE